MNALAGHALTVFMGFFAIMNPIANTPVFLGLTAGDDAATRRKVAIRALTISFAIILLFAATGKLIFHLFGISLPAFRIMGGVLVALVGYQMLHGGEGSSVQQTSEQDQAGPTDEELDVAITPLAMPILAGPGTIATALNFASSGGMTGFLVTIGTFVVLCLISYVCFVSGERLVKYLGRNGVKVVTRLMGLILAVIGVQMLIEGVGGAITNFQKMGVG